MHKLTLIAALVGVLLVTGVMGGFRALPAHSQAASPPTITSISPTSGPAGQQVFICGSGFTNASQVVFGTVQAFPVTFISSTALQVLAPPQTGSTAAASVPVIVTTINGQSANNPPYAYTPGATPGTSAPSCAGTATGSVAGSVAGPNQFIVDTTGSDLNSCLVALNGTPTLAAPPVTAVAPVAVPALLPGAAPTTVTPPAVSPAGGPTTGGTTVTITGAAGATGTGAATTTAFVGNSQVFFGPQPATSVQVINGQLLNAVSPPGIFPVAVSVANPTSGGGTLTSSTTLSAINQFAYGINPVPVVSSLFPNAGPPAGGTIVTVRGFNFANNATVSFGGVPATNVQVTDGFEILATAPPGAPGPVEVQVTNPGFADPISGAQATTISPLVPSSDGFTYGGVSATAATPPPLVMTTAPAGPCATIQGAVNLTRDRDAVVVNAGTYVVAKPIEVPDDISISAGGVGGPFSSVGCTIGTFGSVKTVLRSGTGQPIFHVTAVGSPQLAPFITGFTMGGETSFLSLGAIQLDGSSYVTIGCNIIGQEDLPNVIGILLRNASNSNIHDNIIEGSDQFPISPTLGPTPPVGGFGIVTSECLESGSSDDTTVKNNLIENNSNAAIYFCSNGSGGHNIQGNTIFKNGRGVVLQDANNVGVTGNSIQNNYYDGVEVLGTSTQNIVAGNTIESQTGPSSTGILLQGNGLLFPLDTSITGNVLRRNTTNLYVAGARRTLIGVVPTNAFAAGSPPAGQFSANGSGNMMTAIGNNTNIVFASGNQSGTSLNSSSPTFGQPTDTIVTGNTLLSNGPCQATTGCAVRMMAGATVNIDANGNDWGVTDQGEIRNMIWDKSQDPTLGQVLTATITGQPPLTATPIPILPVSVPPPPPAATPAAGAAAASGAPTTTLAPSAAVAPPTAYIDPASGLYYVELTICVTGPSGQPAPNDQITLSFLDASGNALGSVSVTADTQGCFSGDVQVVGGGATVQPASINLADMTGATSTLPVQVGSPAHRPPSGTLQS